jgi:hypothetical protein
MTGSVDGEMKMSMWMQNEEKRERTNVCLCRELGPEKQEVRYSGEFLYLSPSFLIQCGVSVNYLANGMGPKDGLRDFLSFNVATSWRKAASSEPYLNLIIISSNLRLVTQPPTLMSRTIT